MEPRRQAQRVEDILEPTLLHAVHTADTESMVMGIHTATLERSPTGDWLEALGTRLLLRDFFAAQKGEVSSLAATETLLGDRIRDYLKGMDAEINRIKHPAAADNGGQVSPEDTRRTASITRVAEEVQACTPRSSAELLSYFAEQEVDSMMSVARLDDQLSEIRGGVVERLWPIVQTSLEGNQQAAIQELQQQTEAVNGMFDSALLSVQKWRD